MKSVNGINMRKHSGRLYFYVKGAKLHCNWLIGRQDPPELSQVVSSGAFCDKKGGRFGGNAPKSCGGMPMVGCMAGERWF